MTREYEDYDPEEIRYPGAFGFILSLSLAGYGWIFYTYSGGDPLWYYYGLVCMAGGGVSALLFIFAWIVRPIYLPAVIAARNEESEEPEGDR